MKRMTIILIIFSLGFSVYGYTISQYTKTFYDTSRNRNIQTQVFYPFNPDNPSEVFPYIVFGHGWLVSWSYTQDLTDALVQLGWIVALPTTESGLFPSHQNFAMDLSFLQGAILSENVDPASPLYDKVQSLVAVGGYSMGGGCAILAASYNSAFIGVITFNAAETNPSAISAAFNVNVPSVTFSGSADNIAPSSSHQIPMYNNLASVYKSWISINGATHTNTFSNGLVPTLLAPFLSYLKTGSRYQLSVFQTLLISNVSSLTYLLSNNLPPVTPEGVSIDIAEGIVTISWEEVWLVSGFRIYASNDPYESYADVTTQGNMSGSNRLTWECLLDNSSYRFFRIVSYR